MSKGVSVRNNEGLLICKLSISQANSIVNDCRQRDCIESTGGRSYRITVDQAMGSSDGSFTLFFWEGYTLHYPKL